MMSSSAEAPSQPAMQRKVERDIGGNIRYIFPRAGARMSAKTSPKKKEKDTVEVHKCGGASLSDGAAFRHAVTIVSGRPGPQAVVVAAPAGGAEGDPRAEWA